MGKKNETGMGGGTYPVNPGVVSAAVLDQYDNKVGDEMLQYAERERARQHDFELLDAKQRAQKPWTFPAGEPKKVGSVMPIDIEPLYKSFGDLEKARAAIRGKRMAHGYADDSGYIQDTIGLKDWEAQDAQRFAKSADDYAWIKAFETKYNAHPDDYAPDTKQKIEEFKNTPIDQRKQFDVQPLSAMSLKDVFGVVFSTKQTEYPIKGTNMYHQSTKLSDPLAFRSSAEHLAIGRDKQSYAARRMYGDYQMAMDLQGQEPKSFVDWAVSQYNRYNKSHLREATKTRGSGLSLSFGGNGAGSNKTFAANLVPPHTMRTNVSGWDYGGGWDLKDKWKTSNAIETWQSKDYYKVENGSLKHVDTPFDGTGRLLGVYPLPGGKGFVAGIHVPQRTTKKPVKKPSGRTVMKDVTEPAHSIYIPYEPQRTNIKTYTADAGSDNGWQIPPDIKYTVRGVPVTVAMVEKAAKASGVSVDEYLRIVNAPKK